MSKVFPGYIIVVFKLKLQNDCTIYQGFCWLFWELPPNLNWEILSTKYESEMNLDNNKQNKFAVEFISLNYSIMYMSFFEHFQTDPTNSFILYVNCGVDLGTHPTRKFEYHNESIKHMQSVEKFNNAKITELTISKKKKRTCT
jgi:hypothetical protein